MYAEKYTDDFNRNVEIAKEAESIAKELMTQLIPDSNFIDVSNVSEYYHIGDFMNTNGGEFYDVKEDSCISRTHNVFVEDMKFWNSGKVSYGWMHSEYDNLVILDTVGKHIYILDFKVLLELVDGCRHIRTYLGDNETTGYLVPLDRCRRYNALLYEAEYKYNPAWDCYDVA